MRILIAVFIVNQLSFAQQPAVRRVDPPNWWVGMKTNVVQLMIYGNHLSEISAKSKSTDLSVKKVHRIGNPGYAFIDIVISQNARAGNHELILKNPSGTTTISYLLLKRDNSSGRYQGFDSRDVIYLITPDRFANGDTTNDTVSGMIDTLNRSEPYGRHGGDIQGIINHLDYLRDVEVTALWMNPMVEDNASTASYHGYAATDLYRIDPRFGTNELYGKLVSEAHHRGLKIIMDHVNNHISINHPWIKNLPTPDWLNGTVEDHQKAFHSKIELSDIHSDSITREKATRGWFTDYMPDLNQNNAFVATYLIQNTIWWIESTGLDGIREDTYPYIDPHFREVWCRVVLSEYPRFNIVGEAWIQSPEYLAPYQRGSLFPRKFESHLPSITDFGLFDAFTKMFADSGTIMPVFECLTKDFLFPDPNNLVTFLDNHDIQRIAYRLRGDSKRLKLGLTVLLTTRGIPQLLYGTEIGMMGGKDHGTLRADFPGGFAGDSRNAFTEQGRTEKENDIFSLTKHLLRLRKEHPALHHGSLVHFKPAKEVYTYFRSYGSEHIMVVINNNKEKRTVDLTPFQHQLVGRSELLDLRSGRRIDLIPDMSVEIDGWDSGVFQLTGGPN
ncbi:MAG: Alpha-amylase [Bacteroidetes bacterium]|nr:Alpha-amylase [Bacteroidota bacterium]